MVVPINQLRGKVAFDVESTGLSVYHGDEPYCISFCDQEGRQAILWCEKVDPFTRKVTWKPSALDQARLILSDKRITKVAFNAPFDKLMMKVVGVETVGRIEEVMFAAHGFNSQEPSFKLKKLSEKYLEIPRDDETDLHKATISARRQGKKLGWKLAKDVAADYWMADRKLVSKYCLKDTERTILLHFFYEDFLDLYGIREVYEEELRLMPVVEKMVARGPAVDMVQLKKEKLLYEGQIEKKQKEIEKLAPGVNVNSPKQLSKYLYGNEPGELGLVPSAYTDKGSPSTDQEALGKLKLPFTEAILDLKHSEKTLDFILKYLRLAVPDPNFPGVWCLHCTYNQVGGLTGRFSAREPNLQQVAHTKGSHAPRPLKLRHLFVPRPGYVWVLWDYSQLEIVVFAVVADEPFMLGAIRQGRDIHTESTERIYGGKDNPRIVERARHALALDNPNTRTPEAQAVINRLFKKNGSSADPESEERAIRSWLEEYDYKIVKAETSVNVKYTRNATKMNSFLKIFGGGVNAAAQLIGCSKLEARRILNAYDETFPGIEAAISRYSKLGRTQGFIKTLYGRRIAVDPQFAYTAMNYAVQGSAADLMKRGMRKGDEVLVKSGLDAHMLLTIHDEVIFEIKKEHLYPWLLRSFQKCLEDHEGKIPVGIKVEADIATKNWLEKKELKF